MEHQRKCANVTTPSVESYVPIDTFYEGKQAVAGDALCNRFAVLEFSCGLRVVAARGKGLSVGATLPVNPRETDFLKSALAEGRRILFLSDVGVLVLFGDMMIHGLVPALFPIGDPATVVNAVRLIGRRDLTLSPSIQTVEEKGKREYSTQEVCRKLSEGLVQCDRVFSNRKNAELRLHCAEVAALAGCRVDVRELPIEDFTVCEADQRKWTLFLLCLFLSLRGANAEGASFSMKEIGRNTLTAGMDYRSTVDSRKRDGARFAFLDLPAFRGMELERTGEGYRVTATLALYDPNGTLRANSARERCVFLLWVA